MKNNLYNTEIFRNLSHWCACANAEDKILGLEEHLREICNTHVITVRVSKEFNYSIFMNVYKNNIERHLFGFSQREYSAMSKELIRAAFEENLKLFLKYENQQ